MHQEHRSSESFDEATKDYYALLGLQQGADFKLIEHAYWFLARRYRDAAAHDLAAAARLDELNEAYSVLSTPSLRQAYERAYSPRDAAAPEARPEQTERRSPAQPRPARPKRARARTFFVNRLRPSLRLERLSSHWKAVLGAALALGALAAVGLLLDARLALVTGAAALGALAVAALLIIRRLLRRTGDLTWRPPPPAAATAARLRSAAEEDIGTLRESTRLLRERWKGEAPADVLDWSDLRQ